MPDFLLDPLYRCERSKTIYLTRIELMAEAVVSTTIGQIALLWKDQMRLASGVRREVEFIKYELELFLSFLQNADRKQESDPAVKAWVRQIRDVAYDMEDAVNEFFVRVGPSSRRTGLSGVICVAASCMKQFRAWQKIANKIQDIKLQLKAVYESKERLSLVMNGELMISLQCSNDSSLKCLLLCQKVM